MLSACATAPPAAQVKPAPGAMSVDWTTIGDMLVDTRSKAVIAKDLPGFLASPHIDEAKGMTLQDISPFSGGVINDAKLQQIQTDLNTATAETVH